MLSLTSAAKSTLRWIDRTGIRGALSNARLRMTTWVGSRLSSSEFSYGRYPFTFLERHPPADLGGASELPRQIWSFWVGDNPLTPARKAGLERMREVNPGIPVELITPDRLPDFILPEHPLHPAYELLSYNHRSDYLRAYFLHHYGGGYSDIKPLVGSWEPAFERLDASDAWLLGHPLSDPKWAGPSWGRLQKHLQRYYRILVFGAVLIGKSHTPLTAEWLREVERLLDYHEPALREVPGDMWGHNPGYPVRWMGLQGSVLQPLCLKHQDRMLYDTSIGWDTRAEYR
ncbi:hypothetical protein [Microbacterium thalassium]|uniref:Capsular polysaccharide synthesis protein n=1 Tax=Microbacterium thalassium TaxID=362649 RepID=A0A7X0FN35_9MICO|nr:hypothetical protein [Microbacterium thalassium]MBB6390022.1 hypothetical protein [Microbacterium thalassium]GLK24727.1 hypothetical protein GCM10017607_20450 [Microbacterium thalassium]